MTNIDLIWRVEQALGVRLEAAESLAVGFGLAGVAGTLSDGRKVAVKASTGQDRGDLTLEAFMLEALRRESKLPVPEVYFAAPDLLVTAFVENDGGGITPSVERHAAELIAGLHAMPRPCFGYKRDTQIGPLPQPNPPGESWIPFFRDERLLAMAHAAVAEGRLPGAYLSRIEAIACRLEEHLLEPRFPSLLHGDVWTGNVLVRNDRIAGFLDPAIYYGHPEIELAFSTLFATFGAAFFDAYETLMPLEPGFHKERCGIYNLYPRLVHVRLFGSGIDGTLRRLGF